MQGVAIKAKKPEAEQMIAQYLCGLNKAVDAERLKVQVRCLYHGVSFTRCHTFYSNWSMSLQNMSVYLPFAALLVLLIFQAYTYWYVRTTLQLMLEICLPPPRWMAALVGYGMYDLWRRFLRHRFQYHDRNVRSTSPDGYLYVFVHFLFRSLCKA